MLVQLPTSGDLASRLDSVVAAQEALFLERQPRSRALIERARQSLAGGVTSSWQIHTYPGSLAEPWPRLEDLRRRRDRVCGPARRLRRQDSRGTPTRRSWRLCATRSHAAPTLLNPPRTQSS